MPSVCRSLLSLAVITLSALAPDTAFARQSGLALHYDLVDVDGAGLAEALARFAAAGGTGANITLPHKEAAAALCATLAERARRAG